jgi:hypothetical protein
MRSNLSKHWAGKGFNSPAKQVSSQTKLKDVPSEIGNSIRKGVEAVGNTTVGQAAAKVAGIFGGERAENYVNEKYNKPAPKVVHAKGKTAPNKSEGSSGSKKPVQQAKKQVERIAPKKPIVKKEMNAKPKIDSAKTENPSEDIKIDVWASPEDWKIKKQIG